MTDQELLGAARQALNMGRSDWELNGWQTSIVIASYHVTDNPPLHRMRLIEQLLKEKLGKGWLDDDRKKGHGFYVLRLATAAMPPDAVIIVTPTNMFRPTAKSRKGMGASLKKRSETPAGRRELVAEGYFEMVDSVTACAQTPERVCTCVQEVERGVSKGAPAVHFFNQSEFDGRMKMFGGKIDPEELAEIAHFRELVKVVRERGADWTKM